MMITLGISDDNADDNGMSKGYERLKRWREKHRGLANLRQKEYRKGKTGAAEPARVETVSIPPRNKIEELRALMAAESAKPPQPIETVAAAPRVYRDDYGRVITEGQWRDLERRKSAAAEAGYVLDEFSQ